MATDVDIYVGKRLRRRRRLLGLTQQDLASQVGVRFQQIQKYECGANRISAARLWQLSEALEVVVGFDQVNERAVEHMQSSRLRMIREFTAEQRLATRVALEDGIARRVNPVEMAMPDHPALVKKLAGLAEYPPLHTVPNPSTGERR